MRQPFVVDIKTDEYELCLSSRDALVAFRPGACGWFGASCPSILCLATYASFKGLGRQSHGHVINTRQIFEKLKNFSMAIRVISDINGQVKGGRKTDRRISL